MMFVGDGNGLIAGYIHVGGEGALVDPADRPQQAAYGQQHSRDAHFREAVGTAMEDLGHIPAGRGNFAAKLTRVCGWSAP
jgi:hypothetical protein